MSGAERPGVGNAAGVALLVLNVAGVPALIRSTETGNPHGRHIGYGLAVAVGAASSVLARTPWPVLGTVGMCLLMHHLLEDQPGRGSGPVSPVDTEARMRAGGRYVK